MKKVLLSLFGIITLGLINFSSANYTIEGTYKNLMNNGNFYGFLTIPTPGDSSNYNFSISCSFTNNDSNYGLPSYARLFFYYSNGIYGNQDFYISSSSLSFNTTSITNFYNAYALAIPGGYYDFDYSCEIVGDLQNNINYPSCPDCPSLSGYILESSVDTQYCMLNSLCPSSEVPENFSGSSEVYVYKNNSYHNISGASNIYLNLPEYLGYNFDYSNEGADLDISIAVSQDTGYLEGIINEQSYIPTSEDLSNVFSNFGAFGSLLVVCLFVILVFYMIKKIFN